MLQKLPEDILYISLVQRNNKRWGVFFFVLFIYLCTGPQTFPSSQIFFRFARVHLAWHTSLIITTSNTYEQERFFIFNYSESLKATSITIKSCNA